MAPTKREPSSRPSIASKQPAPEIARQQTDWAALITIVTVHFLACLVLLPWLFSWAGLIALIAGVFLFGQGINLGYHRLLAHRSLMTPQWLEHSFVILALCCLQGTPIDWVTDHRLHHTHSDQTDDPHSPHSQRGRYGWLDGFWRSHVGWLFVDRKGALGAATISRYAKDLLDDKFYRRLQRDPTLQLFIYLAHALLFFVIGFLIGQFGGDGVEASFQMGLSLLVWGVIARTVLVWHITWSVNSVTHLWGGRRYDTKDQSRNNWLIGILAMGEGWHNNHHHDSAAATVQQRWWEIDGTGYVILLLRRFGLATKVIEPRRRRRR